MKKKGRDLEFISRINRDGCGTTPVDNSLMDFVKDTDFEMLRLSISEDTWIATYVNAYVVRIKQKLNNSVSLPSDDRIVAEAIQAARKVNPEAGLVPNNNDIRMFCLGAKWMRDFVHSNDR